MNGRIPAGRAGVERVGPLGTDVEKFIGNNQGTAPRGTRFPFSQFPGCRQAGSWQRDPITFYDVVVPSIPVHESSVLILLQSQNHRHTQRVLGTESVSCADKLNFLTRVGKPQASFVLCIEARCRGPYEWRFLTVTTATRALCG